MNIFISYAHKDYRKVEKLVELIEATIHDVRVWYDVGLSAGQDWWQHILDRIEWCDIFVSVISAKSQSSKACLAEYTYANSLNKPIINAVIKSGKLSDHINDEFLIEARRLGSQDVVLQLSKVYLLIQDGIGDGRYDLPDPLPNRPPFPAGKSAHKSESQVSLLEGDLDKVDIYKLIYLAKDRSNSDPIEKREARAKLHEIMQWDNIPQGLRTEIHYTLLPVYKKWHKPMVRFGFLSYSVAAYMVLFFCLAISSISAIALMLNPNDFQSNPANNDFQFPDIDFEPLTLEWPSIWTYPTPNFLPPSSFEYDFGLPTIDPYDLSHVVLTPYNNPSNSISEPTNTRSPLRTRTPTPTMTPTVDLEGTLASINPYQD
jgi:hypothetical protein